MPEKLNLICDRCKQPIIVYRYFNDSGLCIATAGYYETQSGHWSKYAADGEKIMCDSCMWSDEKYLMDHPNGWDLA